jgi:hypothetical protein
MHYPNPNPNIKFQLEYNVRQIIRWLTDRPSPLKDRPSGERTDRQETSINRQTIGRWTDVRTDCQALDRQTVGDGQAFGWTERLSGDFEQQTDHWAMDRRMDRPSGTRRTDCWWRTGLVMNRQTVRRLRSTDRPSGHGQTYGWRTDRKLYSNVTHFLKIDTFLLPKKDSFLSRKIHQQTEGKSIWGSS